MDYIPSEMLRGHLDTIILLSLVDSDKHSSQIKEFVENRSGGQFVLKQGTFYSCLQRIVKQGYVTEYRTTDEDGVRRKFFQLTEKGKSYIDDNIDSWSFSKQVIDLLISSDEKSPDRISSHSDYDSDDSKPEIAETIEETTEDDASDKLESFLNDRNSDEPIPIVKEKEIASIDYTQAETFFNSEKKEEKIEDGGFEQLSFNPATEPEIKPSVIAESDETEDDREPTIEEKITEIETAKETPPEPKPTKKESSDDFGAADSNVDYRTILEGIFPSSKPGNGKDSREMTYGEGVDVDKFFNESEARTAPKKAAPSKKSIKIVRSEPEKRAKAIEPASEKPSSFYDFSDILNLASEEGFKIRISSNENKKDIGRILINKLNFYSSLIIFGIFFLEAIILFAVTGSVADLNFIPYLIFIVACAVFPLINAVIYFISPEKKTRQISSFKNSIELIIIVCLNLLLIDVVCCVLTSMDFSSYKDLTRYLFYPIIFIATLPFYVVIRYLLLERNNFFE